MFAASFVAALCLSLLVLSRTNALGTEVGESRLNWGERAGRRTSRLNCFLLAEEFRSLRRLWYAAWLGAIGPFGLLFLLLAIFGERD